MNKHKNSDNDNHFKNVNNKYISRNNMIYNYNNFKSNMCYVTRQPIGKGLLLFHNHDGNMNDDKRRLLNKVQYTTDAYNKLDKQASKKDKISKTFTKANNYVGKPRHFSPLSNEWYNSIYTFNMNLLKILPTLNKILLRIVKSYFNFYSRKLEKNIKSRRLRIKARRLSINKILTSKPQLKHTNDQIIITLYTYNRQKIYYLNKLKKIASLDVMDTFLPNFLKEKIFKSNTEDWPSNIKLKTIKNKGLDMLTFNSKINQQKNNISLNMDAIAQANAANNFTYKDISANISYGKSIYSEKFYSFYNNYAAKCLREEILSVYNRQLIYINKSKFDQRYILPLVDLVKKIYYKNIEFNIVDLKYIYLNSYIFSETLLTKLKNRKNNIIKVLDKSLWLFTVPDMDKLAVYNDIYTRDKRLQNLKADSFTKIEYLNLKTSNNNKILQLPFSDNSQTLRMDTINNKQSLKISGKSLNINSEKSLKINSDNDLSHVQPKDKDGVDSLLSAVYTGRSLDIFKNYKTSKHVDNIRKTCNGIFIENQERVTCASTPLNLISSDYTHDKQKKVFKNIKNVDVTGIRIEVAGRLTKRNTAAKSVFKLRYTGNIKDMDSSYKGLSSVTLRGFAKSNLQHTKSESYIRIGSYGMKVWISSFLPRRIYLLLISTYFFYIYSIYNNMLFILFINTYIYT
uniref:ribosomal protein S3 n=1 Tax=Cladonia submitis TaxID=1564456 RepID=UPI0022FD78CB|nr:ribosomal protein S3 [Cladonia submitis]WBP63582.1 ribosomal protein S3 [Cladonia submitis]WBP63598.1 ribosomal protein S3 [Cladonia submitis]WBP63614.1 ribosomal protein S3 [Cladonia submitis]WBP64053.1 ribosomal protein S3 [Cladonia submitis]